MSTPAAHHDDSIPEHVLEAQLAVLRCLYSAVLHDPFWESITIRYDEPEVAIAVVNLVDYEPHSRLDGDFSAEHLLQAVRGEIELLREWFVLAGVAAEAAGSGSPRPGLLTVYRDGVPAAGEPPRVRTSRAA